jgi:hypothetical protein
MPGEESSAAGSQGIKLTLRRNAWALQEMKNAGMMSKRLQQLLAGVAGNIGRDHMSARPCTLLTNL